jgi:hypothetical protein
VLAVLAAGGGAAESDGTGPPVWFRLAEALPRDRTSARNGQEEAGGGGGG